MLCNKQMQQSSATNQLGSILPFLTYARARASYSQTCSDTKPVAPWLRETRMPRIPAQRPRRILLEYGTAQHRTNQLFSTIYIGYKGYIGMAILCLPLLLYARSRTTRCSGTTTTVVNSTPQGLWLERLSQLATTGTTSNKQAIHARPASWHDTPGQYIECTCKLTITRSIQYKKQHGNYRSSRNYYEVIRITWHEQHEHNTTRTI